jgi:hypothetical protein
MRTALANFNRNIRPASPAMWSFAVVQIGKRHFTTCKQEHT